MSEELADAVVGRGPGADPRPGGYVALGLAPHDTVAVMASNRTEHVLADFAGVHAGGTPMSVYATLAPEQVAYVAGHAQPSVVVLEGADQLARWRLALEECPSIAAVVVIDDAALPTTTPGSWAGPTCSSAAARRRAADPGRYDDLWRSVRPEDPLTILYLGHQGPEGRGAHPPQHPVRDRARSTSAGCASRA